MQEQCKDTPRSPRAQAMANLLYETALLSSGFTVSLTLKYTILLDAFGNYSDGFSDRRVVVVVESVFLYVQQRLSDLRLDLVMRSRRTPLNSEHVCMK